MRICVIFNPSARGEKARRYRRQLDQIGAECAFKQTEKIEDGCALAAEAVRQGYDMVVAAGGDGTLNEVLNGIASEPDGLRRVRLGLLPLGTVNVFARELGIPQQFDAAWQIIREGRETRIDLPYVEFGDAARPQRRYFAQLAGAGLDALAIQLVHWPLKQRIGPLAYVIAGLHALLHPASVITVDSGERRLTGELVLVGNGRLYGGDFKVFPGADVRDGLLEICVFPKVNWLTLARCGPALLLRRTLPPRATVNFQAASLKLTSPTTAPLEVDGEHIGRLPAAFAVQPAGLRLIVPQ